MAQNTSAAVMAQRVEPRDSFDDFPTPPWATRALFEEVLAPALHVFQGVPKPALFLAGLTAWEPACNRGYMARPMTEYLNSVHCSDIFDYGWDGQERVCDFLFPGSEPPHIAENGLDLTISNPPFKLAEQFIHRALDLSRVGVAMFVRTTFLEGISRHRRLYSVKPPTVFAVFSERVKLFKGVLRDPNKKYFDAETGEWKMPSSATSYCWLLWLKDGPDATLTRWIPPCHKSLERPGDYE